MLLYKYLKPTLIVVFILNFYSILSHRLDKLHKRMFHVYIRALKWRHNECDVVSNHRRLDCLLSRLFMHRSTKTAKLRVTGRCAGIHWWLINFPHKGQVTRKTFPFDDIIMVCLFSLLTRQNICALRNLVVDSMLANKGVSSFCQLISLVALYRSYYTWATLIVT